MTKNHLKRLAAPKSWPLRRKEAVFVTRPAPTGHSRELSMPLLLAMRDVLGLVTNKREARVLMSKKTVLVDGKRRFRDDAGIGFMDVLALPEAKQFFRVFLDKKGRLMLYSIPEKESSLKLSKVIGKTSLPGGKMQLNLIDGRNIVVNDAGEFKVGDGVLLDVKKKKIVTRLPLEKGALVILTAGAHKGSLAKVTNIEGRIIHLEKDGKSFTTRRRYAFVLGKSSASITIPQEAA
ncbi:30S ribosomal protein S4e [Candidatus Woesearchaeota archaeon]|nr:MAG: 30S ribosomal protein S4e [Candidatus Woesearchaeota archaeon]